MVRDFHWSLSSWWLTVYAVLQVYYVHTNHLPHETPFPLSVKPTDIHHLSSPALSDLEISIHTHFVGLLGVVIVFEFLLLSNFFARRGLRQGESDNHPFPPQWPQKSPLVLSPHPLYPPLLKLRGTWDGYRLSYWETERRLLKWGVISQG